MSCNCDDNINQSEVPSGPAGPTGPIGPSGNNAYGVTTGLGASLGGDSYLVPTSGTNNLWITPGIVIYIQSCGYFSVTSMIAGTSITITDLLYPANTVTPLLNSSGLKILATGIRGSIGATGATGSTGAQGIQGVAGPVMSVTQVTSASLPVTSATDVTIVASATANGKIAYHATLYFESDDALTAIVTPRLNGVDLTAKTVKFTGSAALSGNSCITITFVDLVAISIGQPIVFRVTLDDYTQNTTVKMNLVYNYQA